MDILFNRAFQFLMDNKKTFCLFIGQGLSGHLGQINISGYLIFLIILCGHP
jgi:hypothetical protein